MTTSMHGDDRVTKKTDVLRKIKACLARAAEGSGATANEAATAARQAEAMMRKYGIEMGEVIRQELSDPTNITWAFVAVRARAQAVDRPLRKMPEWPQWMAVPCAAFYDCKAALRHDQKEGMVIAFFGYQMDVEVCCWVFTYLMDCCRRASLALANADVPRGEHMGSYRRVFREGMAVEIAKKLREANDAKRQSMQSTGTSLVVSKDAAIQSKFGCFGTRTGRGPKTDSTAYWEGRAEGKKVNISPNPIDKQPEGRKQLGGQ